MKLMSRLAIFGGTPQRTKPFPSWPAFDESEEQAVLEVLRSGKWWRYSYGEAVESKAPEADQPRSKVAEFQEAFARFQGARYGIACANGTAAIEVALKALGVGPGDEVIVPAYTFIATASAVLMVNAVPIFVDIDSETFNIDPGRVEAGNHRANESHHPCAFRRTGCRHGFSPEYCQAAQFACCRRRGSRTRSNLERKGIGLYRPRRHVQLSSFKEHDRWGRWINHHQRSRRG